MSHGHRSMPLRLGRIIILAAILVGILIAGAGSAHAYSTIDFVENFEKKHPALTFGSGGNASAKQVWTGAGTGFGELISGGGWAAAERYVEIPSTSGSCKASLNPWVHSGSQPVTVNMEVLNRWTWTHIVPPKQFKAWPNTAPYMYVPWWGANNLYVVVRVVLVSPGWVAADNLKIHCSSKY